MVDVHPAMVGERAPDPSVGVLDLVGHGGRGAFLGQPLVQAREQRACVAECNEGLSSPSEPFALVALSVVALPLQKNASYLVRRLRKAAIHPAASCRLCAS